MKLIPVIVVLLGLMSEARAERFEIFVPSECQSLAQQFGVPLVLNSKVQVTYALFKLRRIGASQSGVVECRAAVERLKAVFQARKASGSIPQ